MPPEPVWTRRAEADLLRLHARLEEFSEGSGDQLVRLVDAGLRLVRIMPEMAPLYAASYRRLVLKNPKYGISTSTNLEESLSTRFAISLSRDKPSFDTLS